MPRELRTTTLLCACLLSASGPMTLAQKLEITPLQVMSDEVATVRVSGLEPHAHVTLQAQLVDDGGQSWASHAEFVADADGSVDTSKQAPIKGSYRIVSAMGLVWSMTPTAKGARSYEAPRGDGVQVIQFGLMNGDKEIASTQMRQEFYVSTAHPVALPAGLSGRMLVPNAPGPHPAVLVLGGSEGGMPMDRAAWLAWHGYVVLALAYFHYQGRPPSLEAIPLEYFGRAIDWMLHSPDVLPGQLAVMGTSRGGELALQLGSMYPQLRAVVAYVPANVRFPSCCDHSMTAAWTWKGQALAFANPRSGLGASDWALTPAAIAVENTHGPILVISGREDGVWPSSDMTAEIQQRLQRSHFAYRFERLDYAHAGHRAGNPEIIPAWAGGVRQPLSGEEMNLGGSPEGNAESSLDAIPKVLEFLHRALSVDMPGSSESGATTSQR